MGYKTSATTCSVQLIALRDLPQATAALCETLRKEAGRCWTAMIEAHLAHREMDHWLTEADLKALTKGGVYHLHSQTVQALAEKLIANVDTARALRQQEALAGQASQTCYPHRSKRYQTVIWKDQAIHVRDGQIVLPNGRGQPPLVLPLPARFQDVAIHKAELLWRADHYELALTFEQPPHPPLRLEGQTAGVDLGEINVAAVVTEAGEALVVNGRYLRSLKRLRNKRHAAYQARLARCRRGSRRHRHLRRQQARASAKLYRQQRNQLHQASRKVVAFALEQGVKRLVVGDVRDVADEVDKGRKVNQKISQWPHGQFVRYLTDKARREGISVELIDESYSTRTCSECGHEQSSAPRGRVLRCANPSCGARVHRDANGAANICSRAVRGRYGRIHVCSLTYRRATAVEPRTRARKLLPVAVRL